MYIYNVCVHLRDDYLCIYAVYVCIYILIQLFKLLISSIFILLNILTFRFCSVKLYLLSVSINLLPSLLK